MTDYTPEIQALLDQGGEVHLPRGRYYCASPLRIRNRVRFSGEFPDAELIGGVIVEQGGRGSQVVDLTLDGSRASEGVGVLLNWDADLKNVRVRNFPGHAFLVNATIRAPKTSPDHGNANHFRLDGCRAFHCGGDGLHVAGKDANAGTIIDFDARHCAHGVYDASFLGNWYFGVHTSACSKAAVFGVDPNAHCVVWGFYAEGGQGPLWVGPRSRVTELESQAGREGPGSVQTGTGVLNGGLSVHNSSPQTTGHLMTEVCKGRDAFYSMVANQDDPRGLQWRFVGDKFRLDHANHDRRVTMAVTSNISKDDAGRGEPLPPGFPIFPRGFVLGAAGRVMDYDSSPPDTGQHARGEIVWNTAPEADGVIGWACVDAGEPGTWAAFGDDRTAPLKQAITDLTKRIEALEAST